MSDAPVKKSLLERINDAFYERVEAGEEAVSPETGTERRQASDAGAAAGQPLDSATDLVAKVRAEIEGRGPAFTQFLALVASFADIIPEESGRYRAAMKALEKTGNLSREAVVEASRSQLQAVQSQREFFAGAVDRRREALRAHSGGVEAVRAQIAELQQSIARLQEQERGLLQAAADEEARIKAAEEGFTGLLATMEGEIQAAKGKIEQYLAG